MIDRIFNTGVIGIDYPGNSADSLNPSIIERYGENVFKLEFGGVKNPFKIYDALKILLGIDIKSSGLATIKPSQNASGLAGIFVYFSISLFFYWFILAFVLKYRLLQPLLIGWYSLFIFLFICIFAYLFSKFHATLTTYKIYNDRVESLDNFMGRRFKAVPIDKIAELEERKGWIVGRITNTNSVVIKVAMPTGTIEQNQIILAHLSDSPSVLLLLQRLLSSQKRGEIYSGRIE